MTTTDRSYRERFLTRSRTLDYLRDLEYDSAPGVVTETLYVPLGSGEIPGWEWLPPAAVRSSNGLVLLGGPTVQTAFGPPFPVDVDDGDRASRGPHFSPFIASLTRRRAIAFILLRLGSYAVGVADDGNLIASKTGTRYVKGRHRAGGQSQRRFERNREVWIARLYDQVCRTASDRIGPFEDDLDALATGGDRHVIEGFMKRCGFADRLQSRLRAIDVVVNRPGLKSLKQAVTKAWGCRIWEADPPPGE
ncbi:MAG: Vms1/Ankzf1 family peptidyl-tRNA hydrolase [Dehalococcoidia bacterium]|jgi:hypothetical protein|nr:Vms1/Ankzf1 family peptidyl-tRNA hydrolase [Dehalococcoidia bacterium]